MRVGHGYDVHAFGPGSGVVLGGVKIPHSRSLTAYSDGDVVIHALVDAILGALCLGDIGHHFPDTDAKYEGFNSRLFLKDVSALMVSRKYELGNVDLTVVAETPKLAPHLLSMRKCLAEDLNSTIDRINIKATTTEKLGFVGREEGIACHAMVMLTRC